MFPKNRTIKDIGEFGFIRSIKDNSQFCPRKLIKGIGDDCAVIGPYDSKVVLLSTDLLVENVHFLMDKITPEQLGQKAIAVNLSDIAAMGGKALHVLVSLAVPNSMNLDTLMGVYQGIKNMCRKYHINLAGGDTSASLTGLVINVSVVGEVPEDEVVYRSGARTGDEIYLTGAIGDSAAGLALIKGEASAPEAVAFALKYAHNCPIPHLKEGRAISRSRLASAMIDVSDGLLADLKHLCEESNAGAVLFQETLPLSDNLKAFVALKNNGDIYKWALSGGEDYCLLFTVPEKNAAAFQQILAKDTLTRVYKVGKITADKGISMINPDGQKISLAAKGFEHFG